MWDITGNMKKKILSLAVVLGLAACSEEGASNPNRPDLNAQAIVLSEEPVSFASLDKNRDNLLLCAMRENARQILSGNLKPTVSQVSAGCLGYELQYRASIMAHVRPEWRSDTRVLKNTANTSTRNVYKAGMEIRK